MDEIFIRNNVLMETQNEGLNLPKESYVKKIFKFLDEHGKIYRSTDIDNYYEFTYIIVVGNQNDRRGFTIEKTMPHWPETKSAYHLSRFHRGAMKQLTDYLLITDPNDVDFRIWIKNNKLFEQICDAILDWFLQNKPSDLQEGLNVKKRDIKMEVMDVFHKVADWYHVKFDPIETIVPKDKLSKIQFTFTIKGIHNNNIKISLLYLYRFYGDEHRNKIGVNVVITPTLQKTFAFDLKDFNIDKLVKAIDTTVIKLFQQLLRPSHSK